MIGSPAASEAGTGAQPAACTPTIRTSGIKCLDRHRDTADQPAAADRDYQQRQVGQRLDDLEADRALAGDHPLIVEGMNIGQAAILLEFACVCAGIVEGRAVQHRPRRRGGAWRRLW